MVTPQNVDSQVVAWRVSTRSSNGSGNCVEAGPVDDNSERVAVRHSHRPGGHTFAYDRTEWNAFLAAVKHGDFDF